MLVRFRKCSAKYLHTPTVPYTRYHHYNTSRASMIASFTQAMRLPKEAVKGKIVTGIYKEGAIRRKA
jgi:hypothetical protein